MWAIIVAVIFILIVLFFKNRKKLGYRWSLYIVHAGKLKYSLDGDSVAELAGYVMSRFENHATPTYPWTLVLNFNHTHQYIELKPDHFTSDGEHVTQTFIHEIEKTDPGWMVKKKRKPFFYDVENKKELKIYSDFTEMCFSGSNLDDYLEKKLSDIQEGKEEELTLSKILDQVFEKQNT